MDPMENAGMPAGKGAGGNKTVLYAVIVLVVLALAGIGYLVSKGNLGLPGIGSKAPGFQEVKTAFSNTQSARVQTSFDMRVEPKDADVTPVSLTPPWVTSTEMAASSSYAIVPADFILTGSVGSTWDRNAQNADFDASVTGTYHSGGITADIDLAFRTVKDKFYFQINTLPIPIIDLSPVKGKWVSWTAEDTKKMFPSFADATDTKVVATSTAPADQAKEFMVLWEEGLKQGAFYIGKSESVQLNGQPAWHLVLAIDPAKFQSTFLSIYRNKDTMLAGVKEPKLFTAENYNTVNHEGFVPWLQDLTKTMKLEVWLNQSASAPMRVQFETRTTPKPVVDKFKDKQMHTRITVDFADINKPITVQAPEKPLTLDEAMNLVLGGDGSALPSEAIPAK